MSHPSPKSATSASPDAAGRELDELTLRRAQRGDRDALGLLVRCYQDRVYALAQRLLAGRPAVAPAVAKEAAQDSFVKVLRHLGRFDPHGTARLSTWILTITTRTCLDVLRRQSRSPEDASAASSGSADGAGNAGASATDPEHQAAERQLGQKVERAMATLPDEQRTILVLRAYHDLDYPEIARVLDIEEGTVKSRLSRARAGLRRALGVPEGSSALL